MQLLGASLSTTSLNTYRRPWQLFRQFCSDRLHSQGPIFPISTEHLALFYSISCGTKVCCFNSFNLHFSIKFSPSLSFSSRPYKNGHDSTSTFFTKALSDALRYCNLDVEGYKSHSFRIGAASWAAAKGMSDAQIRAFSRWKSNAFLRYIRTPSLGSES